VPSVPQVLKFASFSNSQVFQNRPPKWVAFLFGGKGDERRDYCSDQKQRG
jgi:hypothetical protein